jgi:hypothetical protein
VAWVPYTPLIGIGIGLLAIWLPTAAAVLLVAVVAVLLVLAVIEEVRERSARHGPVRSPSRD